MNNLDRLLTILKEQADLIDQLNTRSNFQYKSTQRLVLEHGQPFVTRSNHHLKVNLKLALKTA